MVVDLSDAMSDEKKDKIDRESRSMVIITNPLERLVNGWHHKFQRNGIHRNIGRKLIVKMNLTGLIQSDQDKIDQVINLKSFAKWLLERINSPKRFRSKHFATLVDTIVPCKYKFGAG